MVIGMVWYNPKVLGTSWAKLAGVSDETMAKGKKTMPLMAAVGLFFAVVMAYVMAHFALAWGVFDWIGAIELAFWLWIGFVVPPLLGVVLWEGKSVKLYFINIGYWFVAMIVMSLILVMSL